jgi:signal transduction histidine kinase
LGQELVVRWRSSDRPAPEFSVDVEGEPRELDPARRDEIYRVAAEALRNAFQHARASRVEAEFRYDIRQLRVLVRDDGIGADPGVLQHNGRTGHWGLTGMRERARRLGGQLEVWSERGAGTEVQLTVPASIAFAGGAAAGSWLRKRKGAAGS